MWLLHRDRSPDSFATLQNTPGAHFECLFWHALAISPERATERAEANLVCLEGQRPGKNSLVQLFPSYPGAATYSE
jgi:hypothetical protein